MRLLMSQTGHLFRKALEKTRKPQRVKVQRFRRRRRRQRPKWVLRSMTMELRWQLRSLLKSSRDLHMPSQLTLGWLWDVLVSTFYNVRLWHILKATSIVQASITQLVAADWIFVTLSGSHWQATSDAPQVVDFATASAIHWVAQAGIWAAAKLARAKSPKAEYCMLKGYRVKELR